MVALEAPPSDRTPLLCPRSADDQVAVFTTSTQVAMSWVNSL